VSSAHDSPFYCSLVSVARFAMCSSVPRRSPSPAFAYSALDRKEIVPPTRLARHSLRSNHITTSLALRIHPQVSSTPFRHQLLLWLFVPKFVRHPLNLYSEFLFVAVMLVLLQHPLLLCSPSALPMVPYYRPRSHFFNSSFHAPSGTHRPSCAKVLITRNLFHKGSWRLGGGLEFRGLDSLLLLCEACIGPRVRTLLGSLLPEFGYIRLNRFNLLSLPSL